MKLSRIVDDRLYATLNKLATEPLPLRAAFRLKGIGKKAREEYLKYDEVRKEALQKHGLKNEDGTLKVDEKNNAQFDEAGIRAFSNELNELLSMDVELPTLKASELGNVKLSANDLEVLDGILIED